MPSVTENGLAGPSTPTRRELLRRFRRTRDDPRPFSIGLAQRTIASFPFPVRNLRLLDLGCGPGYLADALRSGGARAVVGTDLSIDDLRSADLLASARLASDGTNLPFADATFDGVVCSNVLEHTPRPLTVVDEISRVLAPGGWGWVSWTNWYSPWGGHAISPLHYLGPERGLTVWRRVFGEPKGANLPGVNLWPTRISDVLSHVRRHRDLELLDAVPRYYPSQRWLLRVPGLREVATWNCLVLVRRQ